MAAPIESKAYRQTFAHPLVSKSIWGDQWRAINGIRDVSSGIDEIQDSPADYMRARVSDSYVFRAQDVRGRALSQVPLKVWETDRTGKVRSVDHEALDTLANTNPYNVYVNGCAALMRYTLLSLDGHGRSCWQLGFAGGKKLPTEAYWLVPTAFTPLHGYDVGENVPFAGIRYTTVGGPKRLRPEEIVYFQTDNPADPILGTSKISVLRNALNLHAYSVQSNADFFKNAMVPPWVLSGEWKNTKENVDNIKRALRRHFTGDMARGPLVIGEGATAHNLGINQKDAEWQAMMRIVQEEVSAVYGVPVVYLNNMERATYQNIETAKLMLWHDTMIPESTDLADMLTQRYLWQFWPKARAQRLVFGFDYNTITGLGEDVARIWERFCSFMDRIAVQIERRALTPKQARMALGDLANKLGLDSTPWEAPIPGEDLFYLPFGTLPTEQLGVQAMIDIEAARSSNPNAIDLIENVPGAPTAGNNAQVGIARIQADTQRQLDAQTEIANARAGRQQAALEPILQELKDLGMGGGAPTPKITVKAPHPIPIRENRLAPVQKRLTGRLKEYFQNLQIESLRSLRKAKKLKADTPDPNYLWDRNASKATLRTIIRTGIVESGAAAYGAAADDFNLSVSWVDDNSWIDNYMGQRIHLIDGIDDTTAELLRDSLSEGAQSGETIDQLSTRVSSVFSNAIDSRAETIARTETIQAYGSASIDSYRAAGITQVQMYDGSSDPECAAVNGMVVSPEEAAQLMADEHPNGTRGVAPVVDLGFNENIQAATFVFDRNGVFIA